RRTLTGNAKRSAHGRWRVDHLPLNAIRLQSPASLAAFFAPLTTVPSLLICRLDITDARLQRPDWEVTDLDLSLRNL
ncbi:AsmA family protein, partial [Klebsiella pneumoniae]|nr:AsmA family protein [Klebsiella pneumoniae]